jgi:malonyl-CoA O-methyltransferase
MDSNKIARHFNRASQQYELFASTQYESARKLIELYREHHAHIPIQNILDVGTGTGYIPQLLLNHMPNAQYVLNDIAPNMLQYCQTKFKAHSFNYLLGNIDTINIPKVDLITSNFSLQWSQNIIKTIQKLFVHSNILAITCLLPGTFSEWYELLKTPNLIPYPHQSNLNKHLLELDPQAKIHIKSYPVSFNTPKAFLYYLHQIGAVHSEIKVPLSALKQLRHFRGTFTTKYEILFAVLTRSACEYL